MSAIGEDAQTEETADRRRRRPGRGGGWDGRHRTLSGDLGVDRIVHGPPNEIPVGGERDPTSQEGAHRVRFGAGGDLRAHQVFIDQLPHEACGSLGRLLHELRLAGRVEEIAAKLSGDPNEIGNQALVLGPGVGIGSDAPAQRRHLLIPVLQRLRGFAKASCAQLALVVVEALDVQHVWHGPVGALVGEGIEQARHQIGAGIVGDLVLQAEQLLAGGELRYPYLVERHHVKGRGLRQPGGEDALVQLAVVRGFDRDEDLVIV